MASTETRLSLSRVTNAVPPSGVIATWLGPAGFACASLSAGSLGVPRRATPATVSGGAGFSTLLTPLSSTDLPSLADTAIQPRPVAAGAVELVVPAQAASSAQAAAAAIVVVLMGRLLAAGPGHFKARRRPYNSFDHGG